MTSKQILLVPLLVAIAVGILLLFLDSEPLVVEVYPLSAEDSSSRVKPPLEETRPQAGSRGNDAPAEPTSEPEATEEIGRLVDVTGVVFDRDGAVEGATVFAVAGRGDQKAGTKQVKTGADGRYRIQLRPGSGSWSVVGQAPGYIRTISDQFSAGKGPIILDIELEEGFTISGHISNSRRQPIAGMEIFASLVTRNLADAQPWRVRAVLSSSENSLRFGRGIGGLASTDERGWFEIGGLQPTDYHLSSISVDYALEHPILVNGGDANLELVASERNWVVIHGYDARDGKAVPGLTATIRFQILFADGTFKDRGQSVGTGDGTIEMFLYRSIFSPTARQGKVVEVTPYGEAEAPGYSKTSFEGSPIRPSAGGSEIEVVLAPAPVEE